MSTLITVNGIDFTFYFDTQVIDVDASVDSLEVYDLWVAIRTAAATPVGIAYPPIAKAGGLDTLDQAQGIQTFITVTLFENWEVNSLKSSGKFTLTAGNLLRADGSDPFLDNPLITYFAFFSQAGTVTTVNTGSGVTEQDKDDIADRINPNIDLVLDDTSVIIDDLSDKASQSSVDLVVDDMGLNTSAPKTITENTEGESYDESTGSVVKQVRKVGAVTTITRTS